LEENGIIEKRPYQSKPLRYEYLLSRKGADLLPVLQQLGLWAHRYVPGSLPPPAHFMTANPEDLLANAGNTAKQC
jgi:DNA-binding HxlR family transcriptional regulator